VPGLLALVGLLALLATILVHPEAVAAERPVYRPPTDAPVRDPFRPPPQPWLPGNRGIEYDTAPGSVVTAIGQGRISFAGLVAGRLIATVEHPDGLRSSYTGLAGLAVHRGDRVMGGQVVGLVAGPFHLGVRRGDHYLDPASLWGRPIGAGRVLLVPDRAGPAPQSHPAVRSFGTRISEAMRAVLMAS